MLTLGVYWWYILLYYIAYMDPMGKSCCCSMKFQDSRNMSELFGTEVMKRPSHCVLQRRRDMPWARDIWRLADIVAIERVNVMSGRRSRKSWPCMPVILNPQNQHCRPVSNYPGMLTKILWVRLKVHEVRVVYEQACRNWRSSKFRILDFADFQVWFPMAAVMAILFEAVWSCNMYTVWYIF